MAQVPNFIIGCGFSEENEEIREKVMTRGREVQGRDRPVFYLALLTCYPKSHPDVESLPPSLPNHASVSKQRKVDVWTHNINSRLFSLRLIKCSGYNTNRQKQPITHIKMPHKNLIKNLALLTVFNQIKWQFGGKRFITFFGPPCMSTDCRERVTERTLSDLAAENWTNRVIYITNRSNLQCSPWTCMERSLEYPSSCSCCNNKAVHAPRIAKADKRILLPHTHIRSARPAV